MRSLFLTIFATTLLFISSAQDTTTSQPLSIGQRKGANVIRGVRFIQQGSRFITVKWVDKKMYTDYTVEVRPESKEQEQTEVDGRRNTRKIDNLLPSNVYWVTVRGTNKNNVQSTPVTIKVYTSPEAAKNVRMVQFTDEKTVLQWENPQAHRPQAKAIAVLSRAPKKIRSQKLNEAQDSVEITNMPAGTSYDIRIFYVYNRRRSDTYIYRVTRVPGGLDEFKVDEIDLVDDGLADVQLSWKWPKGTYWGGVKLEYSPPTPTAKQPSPHYITDRNIPVRLNLATNRRMPSNKTSIEGLKQGVVYTFAVSLVKGPLESQSLVTTQGIPLADPSGASMREATALTCRVPLDLNPLDLAAQKNLVGEPSLVISWTHPKKKAPEDGYKVVVVPFAESITHLPKIYYVPSNSQNTELVLAGNDFDPFIEYSISVVAKHTESMTHENPNGPEFTARVFTGQYVKIQGDREVFVVPDACCGSNMYNQQEKSCCGGSLYDHMMGHECCGWVVYDKRQYMCCNAKSDPPIVKTITEGCGFGKKMDGSGKRAQNRAERGKRKGKRKAKKPT